MTNTTTNLSTAAARKCHHTYFYYFVFVALLMFGNGRVNAQPSAMSVNTDVSGAYSNYGTAKITSPNSIWQCQKQEGTGQSSGVRNWQFNSDGYYNTWGAESANTLTGYNTFIAPNTSTASGNFQGGPGYNAYGKLPATVSGDYYTYNINVGTSYASQNMAVLQTAYLPKTITAPTSNLSAYNIGTTPVISFATSATPSTGEYFYVRYSSTTSFASSSLVLASVSGTTGSVTLPAMTSANVGTVYYYVFSSPISTAAGITGQTGIGSDYDLMMLNINASTGGNFYNSFTVNNTYVSTATGNWNTGATWVGGTVPASGANVIISPVNNVTLNVAATVGTLYVQSNVATGSGAGGTLTINSNSYALTATTINDTGTVTITAASTAGLITATNFNVANTGIFTNSAAYGRALVVTNFNVNNGGTYTHNAPSASTNGLTSDFPGGVSGGTVTLGATSIVSITNWAQTTSTAPAPLPTPVSGWGNLTVNIPTLGGNWNQNGALNTVVGTLTITNVGGGYILGLGSGTSEIATIGALAVNGATAEFAVALGTAACTANITGAANFSNGVSTLAFSSGRGVMNVGGNFSQTTGTFYQSYSTGSSDLNITGTASFTSGSYYASNSTGAAGITVTGLTTINGATVEGQNSTTANDTFNLNGGLTLSSGSFHLENSNSTVANSILNINGTSSVFTLSGGTFYMMDNTSTNGGSANINMTGTSSSVVISSGTLYLNYENGTSNASDSSIIRLAGSFSMTGGSIIWNNYGTGYASGNIYISGNFSITGTTASLSASYASNGQFIFNGTSQTLTNTCTGTQKYTDYFITNGSVCTLGATPFYIQHTTGTNDSMVVYAGGTLMCGANILSDNSTTGRFFNYGTLGIGSGAGITSSGATGNIENTGTRTFGAAAGANYIYNGTAAQVTGNALPASFAGTLTINNTVASPAGVTLTQSTTAGNLALTAGLLIPTTFSLTNTSGTVTGGSSSSYILTQSTGNYITNTSTGASTLLPLGSTDISTYYYDPITIGTTSSPVTLTSQLLIGHSRVPGNPVCAGIAVPVWNVTTGTATSANVTFNWLSGNDSSGYVPTSGAADVGIWSGSYLAASLGTPAGAGTNASPYTVTASSLSIPTGTNEWIVGPHGCIIPPSLPPTITSFSVASPGSGTSGYTGCTVNIVGTNLMGCTSATIGGTAATIVSQSGTSMVLTVGAGASGVITTTNSAGTATSSGSFTYLGYITTATGDWNTGATWLGGGVPIAGAVTTIANNPVTISVGSQPNPSTITINSGALLNVSNASGALTATTITNNGTLTYSAAGALTANTVTNNGTLTWTAAGTLNIAASGTLTNNTGGSFTCGIGTVVYAGAGTLNGTLSPITLNNLTINGTVTTPSSYNIQGILLINGGNITSTPTYTSTSTLTYNVAYTPYLEWTGNGTTAGAGIPQNVIIEGTAAITMPTAASTPLGMAGNFSMTGGSLTLSATSGDDLYVGGNWTRTSGTFSPNSRAVFFDGSATQTLTVTGSETFNYLVVSGSGTLKLASAVTVNAVNGLSLASTNGTSTIDLNGNVMTVSGGGNLSLNSGARIITSSATGGYFKVTSALLTVTSGGSLTIAATNNPTLELVTGFDCGSGNLTTINGSLQIDAGGYVSTDAPIYGSASFLVYNSATTYGQGTEWSTGSTVTAGTGTPQNVTIQNGTTLSMSASNHAFAGNLNVTSGGLTLNTGSGDIYAGGNWTRAASTTFTPNLRAVFFAGASAKTITVTGGETFAYLLLTGGNVTLASAATVSNTLTLTSGLLILGTNNLTLASASSGGSTSSYIVTNSSGSVIQTTTSSATSIPIGASTTTTTFAPITITGASTYTCAVSTTVPGTPISPTTLVNLAWSIVASGSTSAAVSFQWNAANDASGFVPTAACDLGIYTGSYSVSTPWTPSGSNPYTLAVTGLTIPGSGTNKYVIGNTGCFVCSSTTIPYTENFDGATTPALPGCWAYLDVDGDGFYWQTNNASSTFPPPSGGSSPNALFCRYNATAANNDWAFSKGVTLAASTVYQVSFLYAAKSASFVENLSVSCGASQTVAGMTTLIGTEASFSNTAYATATFTFTSGAAGVYYFGLHDYSIANQYGIFVDNFSVINFTPVNYTWTGTTNSDWGTSTNWSPNGVPSSIDNVTIPTTTNPCIVGASAYSVGTVTTTTAGNFQMASGSTLTINGAISFGSSVTPTFACSSTLNLASTSSITVPAFNYGSLNLTGGSRVLASSGTIGICNIYTPGSGAITNTSSTINYNGSGAQTITACNYNNLTISSPRTTNSITLDNTTVIDVAGTFSPTMTFTTGGVIINTSTINFSGAAGQAIPAFYYYNLTNYTVGTATNTGLTRTWASSGIIDINYAFVPSTGVNTITGSTVNYSSASGVPTIYSMSNINSGGAGDYYNLSFSGSDYWYCPSTLTVANNLTMAATGGRFYIAGSATYGHTTATASVAGNVTLSAGTIYVSAAGGTGTLSMTGNTATYTQSAGTLNLLTGAGAGNFNMTKSGSSASISAGNFYITNYSGGGTSGVGTVTLAGSFSMSGGSLDFAKGSGTSSTSQINLAGNFTLSNGATLNTSGAAANGTILFNGTTTQTINATGWTGTSGYVNYTVSGPTPASTVLLASNFNFAGPAIGVFTVNAGGTLNFGGTNYLNDAGANGTFTNNGTLIIGSPNGITSGTTASGNVQSTGTRTYATTGNYTYAGTTTAQATGNGLPASMNNLTIANTATSGVVQFPNILVSTPGTKTINGNLIFTSGSLDLNGNTNITLGTTSSIVGESCTGLLINSGTAPALNGWIGTTRTLAANPGNVANLGINLTSASAMGSTVIKRFPKAVSAINALYSGIKRIYSITPATTSGSSTTASYTYCATELNSNVDGILSAYYSTGTNETVAASYALGATVSDVNPTVVSNISFGAGATTFITFADPDKICTVTNGDWNTGSTWISGSVPLAGQNICINNAITVGVQNTALTGNVTLNSGGSLAISAPYAVNIGLNGIYTNSSTGSANVVTGSGAVVFSNGGTIAVGSNATTFNNLTLTSGTLTIPTSNIPTVNGTFTLNGGSISNPIIYGSASTLLYNLSYGRFNEWNASGAGTIGTTPGYPNNVHISNNSSLDLGNGTLGTSRAMAGSLTIDNGSTLTMNTSTGMTQPLVVAGNVNLLGTLTLSGASGGDIKLGGNWAFSVGGTFNSNARAVFFTGSSTSPQVISRSAAGTLNFDYIINSNTSGGIKLASSPATNININAPSGGNGLSFSNASSFDLNGNTCYITASQSISTTGADVITSTAGTGTFNMAANTSTSVVQSTGSGNTLTFASPVTVLLSGGGSGSMDFGSALSTVNGILQLNPGSYVANNAPTYGIGSTLVYNTGGPYSRNVEFGAASAGPGYPYNVLVENGTFLDLSLVNTLSHAIGCTGDLAMTGSGSGVGFNNAAYSLSVGGNVNIGSGSNGLYLSTFGGGDIYVGGNWTNSGGSFVPNSRAVLFNGTKLDTITTLSTDTFAYLFIQKTAAADSILLNSNITVTSVLNLTTGIINTRNDSVIIKSNATGAVATGYSASSYINGYLKRAVTAGTSYDFPVGAGGKYELANITFSSGMTGTNYLTANFNAGTPTAPSPGACVINGTPMSGVLNAGYWSIHPDVQPTAGTYTSTLTLTGFSNTPASYSGYTSGGVPMTITPSMQIGLIKRTNSSSAWKGCGDSTYNNAATDQGLGSTPTGTVGGSISGGVAIVSRKGVPSFSDFGIGIEQNPTYALPVQLIYFIAANDNNNAQLNWATASEISNDHFDVERSVDGVTFEKIGQVAGHDNSNVTIDYSYTDADISSYNASVLYYRLKQVDVDGNYTYTNIASVNVGNSVQVFHVISSFPNPFSDHYSVSYYAPDVESVKVSIYDVRGALISEETMNTTIGMNVYTIPNAAQLPSGFYSMNVNAGGQNIGIKMVKQ